MRSSIEKAQTRPRIALAMGDPAGISPELTARLLADREVTSAGQILVIGDGRVLAEGARIARVVLDIDRIAAEDQIPERHDRPVLLDLGHLDPKDITVGKISKAGGSFAVENFKRALTIAIGGQADAVAFTPFNKAAMRLAHPGYEDEIVFTSEMLKFDGMASEFNILPDLWNARVTSHVPLSGVAPLITEENILRNLKLTDGAMRNAGFVTPRIAVAGLNPHAGDGGNFGREEIEIIEPAVRKAKAIGIVCDGPLPPDTVFVRAKKGEFDAVLTMYHDQGQIAMKLMGFDRGATLIGGFPFPICTPAHGTAYEIAGKGIANAGAGEQALLLAARIARRQQLAHEAVG
jgi:4-hydroxythreonine-4-phosphate dehydrogenase